MRQILSVLVAGSISFAPAPSHAGALKSVTKVMLGGGVAAVGLHYMAKSASAKNGGMTIGKFLRNNRPAVEAIQDGLATRKQFKSYQENLVLLGAAKYVEYIFAVCTTGSPQECAKAVDYFYLAANLYLDDNNLFVQAICSVNSNLKASFNNDLLTEIDRRIPELTPHETYSEQGQELIRLREVVHNKVVAFGNAALTSPRGFVQPGCKYTIQP